MYPKDSDSNQMCHQMSKFFKRLEMWRQPFQKLSAVKLNLSERGSDDTAEIYDSVKQ